MTENELSNIIIREAIYVHETLGPGLLESIYKECLYFRLAKAKLHVRKEVPLPVIFASIKMECGYRAELIVENKVIIEVKCVDALADIHTAQALTYLRLTNIKTRITFKF